MCGIAGMTGVMSDTNGTAKIDGNWYQVRCNMNDLQEMIFPTTTTLILQRRAKCSRTVQMTFLVK